MARSNALRDLATLPWPLGLLAAGIVWIALRHVAPALLVGSGNPLGVGLAPMARGAAPVVTSLCLIATAISWWRSRSRSWDRGRLLDSRTDLASIRALPWDRFEHLVGEAFRRRGYRVRENAVAGADRGIDLVLTRADETVLVQCKRWDKPIGVPIVRELLGAVTAEGASGGILVASSLFTAPARSFAQDTGIELVDGAALTRMIDELRRSAPPSTSAAATAPLAERTSPGREPPVSASGASSACPLCGSPMTRRTARRGARAGTDFLGCTMFPGCRGTRQLD